MKLGALGLPAYRTFSLEEIEEATGNFDSSAFMGEGSYGQVRKISLKHTQSWLYTTRDREASYVSWKNTSTELPTLCIGTSFYVRAFYDLRYTEGSLRTVL